MIISELIDPNVRVQKFLNLLDTITENKGLNVQQIVKIEQLRSLPLGTFGRKWADFLDDNNIQPFTTGIRRKQLHDGVHILTGYGIDSIGEAEVQAFLLGSKFTIANLILGLVFLRKIHHNLSMQNSQKQLAWKRIKTAYQRGCASNFNPDTWQPEKLWNLPLIDVHKMFSIQ